MQLFTLKKEVDIDLKQFSLIDISDQLEKENFFIDSPPFYVHDKINANRIVFRTPRNKATPRELYDFEYFPDEKKIRINGKYENKFFPSLLIYTLPLLSLYFYLTSESRTEEQFKTLMWVFIGVSIYHGIIIFSGLSGCEPIERELKSRWSYLLRKN